MVAIYNKKKKGTLFAMYGVLREGGSHFNDIDTDYVKRLGIYNTYPRYTMFDIEGVYPGLKKQGNTSITLEIFKISSICYENIIDEVMGFDILEPDKSLFKKSVIYTPFGNSYIYFYNNKITKANKIIESGDWIYNISTFNKNTTNEHKKMYAASHKVKTS